jgi:hypothetical protein
MPPSTQQKALINQFMSITGVREKDALRVSYTAWSIPQIERATLADCSFFNSCSKRLAGSWSRLWIGKILSIIDIHNFSAYTFFGETGAF